MNSGTDKELIAIIEPGGAYALDWQITDTSPSGPEEAGYQRELYESYSKDPDRALFYLGLRPAAGGLSPSVAYLRSVAASFIKGLTRNPDLERLRGQALSVLDDEEKAALLESAPFLHGGEHLNGDWLDRVWARLNQTYRNELGRHTGSVTEFFTAQNPEIHLAGKVYFHLVESRREDYPFAFLATYAAEISAAGKVRHLPLQKALMEYGMNSKKLLALLSTVHQAARSSSLIAGLLESGEIFHPIGFSPDEAYVFLKETPLYEASGILCRIPNWWRKKTEGPRVSISIGTKAPSRVGAEALLDFDVRLALGDETLTVEEVKSLLAASAGLAFIKGKWVEVDPERLRETLAAYEEARRLAAKGGLTLAEALRLQFASAISPQRQADGGMEITNGQWLESVLAQLKRPETIPPVDCGTGFQATLREYQKRGLAWLHTMKTLGLGACLADDMGLGKTVQVIALLNHAHARRDEKTLIVVPASLISNWTAEIAKFAPGLRTVVLHSLGKQDLSEHDISGGVYITSYGMLARTEWLQSVPWDTLILDEAQAIKNPATKQAKAAKRLQARHRIALTGTPVENRLADLWSIFDFLNRGLLGTAKEFTAFAQRIQAGGDGYARLRQIVSPFILRRLKTDRNIIADLPEKVEMKAYAALTKKQAALYKNLVDELEEALENSAGIERKGLVLATLMKLKQICNHPDQFLGQSVYDEKESGKYIRLREICETIREKRERVLVFTQFKEIAEPLAAFLAEIFGREGLVLHGGTPVARRKEIVDRFQGREYVPFMVLSIKAGGVGLNLTAANHVIHFDRWWNPAVENQATDRAFRIGQKKSVIVHKFITQGTVEERIDRMIEDKTALAREIVPEMNESWITEMENRELMELFRLRA
ncbi:MAG: DEAD/DEAH box helicase [Firmicutes bacterium]|nr:DEAD/DEAH box helicase [Bacillota bacterium]